MRTMILMSANENVWRDFGVVILFGLGAMVLIGLVAGIDRFLKRNKKEK